MLKVIDAGLYSTIQDLGRYGYLQYGVPSSGALDYKSHILANSLLGNDFNSPTIEMTYLGASFIVIETTFIAVVGADMGFKINGEDKKTGQVIKIFKNDEITFEKASRGMRTYIAISGGFHIKKYLGSQSTHENLKLGKRIQIGEILEGEYDNQVNENLKLKRISNERDIRVIRGQQFDYFNDENIAKFLNNKYKISNKFDRMGFRLKGDILESKKGYDILSEPTLLGSIQVPANGQPIVLLNERQTIGGYPKIATVVKADIPKLAQLQPGELFSFKLIEHNEALSLYKQLVDKLNQKQFLENYNMNRIKTTKRISKIIGGKIDGHR